MAVVVVTISDTSTGSVVVAMGSKAGIVISVVLVAVGKISVVDVATIGATAAEAVSITAGVPEFCVAPQAPAEILITSFST